MNARFSLNILGQNLENLSKHIARIFGNSNLASSPIIRGPGSVWKLQFQNRTMKSPDFETGKVMVKQSLRDRAACPQWHVQFLNRYTAAYIIPTTVLKQSVCQSHSVKKELRQISNSGWRMVRSTRPSGKFNIFLTELKRTLTTLLGVERKPFCSWETEGPQTGDTSSSWHGIARDSCTNTKTKYVHMQKERKNAILRGCVKTSVCQNPVGKRLVLGS